MIKTKQELLEQQPCEDAVSRQMVLQCIKESREGIDWGQSEDEDAFLHYSAALYRTIASKECLPSVTPQQKNEDMGEVSDGYHTFNQLYHQRAILFATIVNQNKDRAWKSYKHEDGKYCFDKDGEWFIVGIDTPKGSYTYHYSKEYWDMFDCQELECGKEWDGHTEEDVIRLLSLPSVQPQPKTGEWLTNPLADYAGEGYFICSKCKNDVWDATDYCPNCGSYNGGGEE